MSAGRTLGNRTRAEIERELEFYGHSVLPTPYDPAIWNACQKEMWDSLAEKACRDAMLKDPASACRCGGSHTPTAAQAESAAETAAASSSAPGDSYVIEPRDPHVPRWRDLPAHQQNWHLRASTDHYDRSFEQRMIEKMCRYCCAIDPRLRCARCHKTRYCNVECQRKNWPTHKHACKPPE